jgi:hypothetical protein
MDIQLIVTILAWALAVVGIFTLIAYAPLLIWRFAFKRQTGPTFSEYSSVLTDRAIGWGILAFFVGFFGPMVFDYGQAQGPMLGFVTGPLGAIVGVFGSWVWFYVKRADTS